MSKAKLSVIIPSRAQERQVQFLERAVASVRQQSVADKFQLTFLVGVDQGLALDANTCTRLGIVCVPSSGASQAAALNAAIRRVDADFVAFLEDDDEWMPQYLEFAAQAAAMADFVSSTQAEYDEKNELLRINDFPTPSGWFMPVSTLKQVGEFNEAYRFHLDNEWLGRLAEAKLRRLHMAECTAPIHQQYLQAVRPWLANVINGSGGTCRIARHASPYPLVKRLVHSQSGMARIVSDQALQAISQQECAQLTQRFGRIPW